MSLLNKAKTNVKPEDIKGGKERDTLGGGSVQETGVYGYELDSIYTTESKSGAVGIVVNLLLDNGSKYSETMYITTGRDKGCNPYFEKNGEKTYLPSYVMLDSFANMVTGKGITDQDTAERVLNVWDYESKSEKPTKVEALVDLFKVKGFVAITKTRSNKQVKGDNGYIDSPDERFTNNISKFFNDQGQTSSEQTAGVKGDFLTQWKEKYTGVTVDKYKKVEGVAAGAPAAKRPSVNANAPVNAPAEEDDLFKDPA